MRKAAILATAAALVPSVDALACGESLFRVGRGVEFREYTAPLPGNIVVVASTESELAMVERLAAAGHDVHVVADPAGLRDEIENSDHEFDIVIAHFRQRNEVESQMAMTSIDFIPVALEGDEEAAAGAIYDHYLPDQGSVKRFLKTIHSALRARA
jgi:hypothetical protein